jgi:hypothetical protein
MSKETRDLIGEIEFRLIDRERRKYVDSDDNLRLKFGSGVWLSYGGG